MAQTLRLHLKVSDGFTAKVLDDQGQVVGRYEGYVPRFFPGDHYGDYVLLDIDAATGQITNWRAPTAEQLAQLCGKRQDEDE